MSLETKDIIPYMDELEELLKILIKVYPNFSQTPLGGEIGRVLKIVIILLLTKHSPETNEEIMNYILDTLIKVYRRFPELKPL